MKIPKLIRIGLAGLALSYLSYLPGCSSTGDYIDGVVIMETGTAVTPTQQCEPSPTYKIQAFTPDGIYTMTIVSNPEGDHTTLEALALGITEGDTVRFPRIVNGEVKFSADKVGTLYIDNIVDLTLAKNSRMKIQLSPTTPPAPAPPRPFSIP